jgi:hypothetical protein
MRKDAVMNKKHLMIISLLIFGALLITACGLSYTQGSGNVITEERDVSGFDQVNMSGFGEMIITQGNDESLTIETDDNLMQFIETEVRNNTLYLEFTENTIPDPSDTIAYHLTLIDLEALELSGAGEFSIQSLDTPRLEITFSGAGRIDLDSLNTDELTVQISGAGDVNLAGKVSVQEVNIEGAGQYLASDLESDQASVKIEGVGKATIWAHDSLDIRVDGAGNVEYYGSPTVNQNIQGGGSIRSLGQK